MKQLVRRDTEEEEGKVEVGEEEEVEVEGNIKDKGAV
jgi:hypothetical protein